MDITRYAEVVAHLRHFPADKHAEVIARLGIRRRDWDTAAAKWRTVRDAERMSGKLEVTVRFGKVMAETRTRLAATQPSIESLGSLPRAGEGPAAAATAAPRAMPGSKPEEATSVAALAVQVPSYLAADSFDTPPPRRPPSELASTSPIMALPALPAMPFVASTGAHTEVVQGPPRPRRAPVGSGTVGVGDEVSGPPLPPGAPALTLQQYASLRIELEMNPEGTATTLSRYGVAPDTRAALEAYWKARLSMDRVLEMTYARTYAQFVAWFKANRR